MSKYDRSSTARLPLIESVIIIAIFAIVSVAIMRLYVAADKLQQKAVNISKATIAAENLAEAVKADAIIPAGSRPVYSEAAPGAKYTVNYDGGWQQLESQNADDAAFTATAEVTGGREGSTGTLSCFKVTVKNSEGEVLAEVESSYITAK